MSLGSLSWKSLGRDGFEQHAFLDVFEIALDHAMDPPIVSYLPWFGESPSLGHEVFVVLTAPFDTCRVGWGGVGWGQG